MDEWSPMIAAYKKNNISVEVKRASQTHHVPQVGLPHIDPVTKATRVKPAPNGAAEFINIPAIFALQTMEINPPTAIRRYMDSAKIADGT
jgi:hypothetical protein